MEIQLTKTKTITIGGAKASRGPIDIVGVELFGGDSRGCPAVRLVEKKGTLQLAAAGFVSAPDGVLPSSWEEASHRCSWSLPSAFQAPTAAIAVSSPDMILRQTTLEAFKNDLANGISASTSASNHSGNPSGTKRVGIIKSNEPKVAATLSARLRGPASATPNAPQAPVKAIAPASSTPVIDPASITPGTPLSSAGTRFIMREMPASEGFIMEAAIPEYQLLWLSRLLPEGRRPTAASIQLVPSATTASILAQPSLETSKGAALVLFVGPSEISIAGYKDGDIAFWRNCRGVAGELAVRNAVMKELGIGEDLIDGVLDDNLIDPGPALAKVLEPVLGELAVSRDYLVGKLGVNPDSVMLMGLKSGARPWASVAAELLRIKLVQPGVFDGIVVPEKLRASDAPLSGGASHVFLGALGAALALREEMSV